MELFALLDLGLVAVAALGIGGWQLWSVNREIRRDRERKAAEENAASD